MIRKIKIDKKGVSEMIGYVLLIAGVVAMSAIVYVWLRSYVPRETPECPDGVSLFVQSSSCVNNILTLEIKNNGRFSVYGYYIRATTTKDQAEQGIATKDLSGMITTGGTAQGGIVLFPGLNKLDVGANMLTEYSLDTKIFSIEIIPVLFETTGGKNRQTVCGNAKIKEMIDCKTSTNIPAEVDVVTFNLGEIGELPSFA